MKNYKYFAFISYNSRDTNWGKQIQRKLEGYKMPSTLCSEHGWNRKPLKPIFFAPTDIQPGGLTEELQERLKASKNLIVICSPNSARSEWVGKEIEFFHNLGRTKQLHFFIVDGIPHSGNPETECFNPIVDRLGLPEILGANIHEKIYRIPWLNKERAYVQLITKLLGVEFDSVWQRHKRSLIEKSITWFLGILAIVASLICVWLMNKPIDIKIKLNEVSIKNSMLPPMKDAVVTLKLDNETKTDTICSIDEFALFSNIPRHYLNQHLQIAFTCQDFNTIDTIVTLQEEIKLNITRDPDIYGNVHFLLWNPNTEVPVANKRIVIGEYETISDEDGKVSLQIPIEGQRNAYPVKTDMILENDTIYMPCGENDILLMSK